MKKIVFIFVFFTSVFVFVSCKNGNNSEKFVGQWKISEVKIENPEDLISTYIQKLNIDSVSAEQLVNQSAEGMKQLTVTFNADSTYDFASDTGHWLYDDKNNKLTLQGDKNIELQVTNINDNELDGILVQQQPFEIRYLIKMLKQQ